MSKLLKNLEYLIPVLAGMSNWVKCLVVIWVILTVVLLFTISSITYAKNKEKSLKEKSHTFEVAKTQINRQIEDYALSCGKIVEQFPKEVNKINGNFNARGMFQSGGRILSLWEMANEYKAKIDTEYRKLSRNIEDILLNNLKQKDIHSIPELKDASQRINELYAYCSKQKKEFERSARKADLGMYKNNPIIDENFRIIK